VEVDAFSVYRAFEQIPDGPHQPGVGYRSAWIFTLIVLAKLAGMTSLAGRAEWVRLPAAWLKQVLPNARESFPCAASYCHGLRALDAQQVTQVLNDLLMRLGAMKREDEHPTAWCEEQQVPVALHGKTLRGT
jgi:DDE_Tnp_1-associated